MTDDLADAADDVLDGLIHRADLDGLVRLVDARTASRDWAGLSRARDRARHAIGTGRQLWPVATLAEYRLALRAPVEWAAPTIADGAGLFTIGPLTEVIAQEHSWQELADVLAPGPAAGVVAHERVLRGEPVDAATVGRFPAIEMPYQLADWEPAYLLATYRDDGVEAPAPPVPTTPGPARVATAATAERLRDDVCELAVRQLVEPWTAESNGRAEVASVVGSIDDAVSALGVGSRRTGEISLDRGAVVAGLGGRERWRPRASTRRRPRPLRRAVDPRRAARPRRRLAAAARRAG